MTIPYILLVKNNKIGMGEIKEKRLAKYSKKFTTQQMYHKRRCEYVFIY